MWLYNYVNVTTLDYEAIEEYVDMDETLQNRTETQKLGESLFRVKSDTSLTRQVHSI